MISSRQMLAIGLILCGGGTWAQVVTQPNPAALAEWRQRFIAAATRGFVDWDLDKDGLINLVESSRGLGKPEFKGDVAAALATIHELLRGTQWRLNALSLGMIQEPARRPLDMPPWEPLFQRMVAAVEKPSAEVFMNGAPRLEGLKQGREGNCYLLAVIGAQLNKDPALIKAMIQPREGGALVDFQTAKVTVPALTDAERALAATSADQGTWLSLVEKAWGTLDLARKRERFTNPLDGAGAGGDPAFVIQLLTGRRTISRQLIIEDGISEVVRELDFSLRMAKQEKRIACAGTDGRRLPPGIVPRHAYAILDYNPRSRVITLWNPWGLNRNVPSEPGLQRGYTTVSGKFEMPIGEFVRVFDVVFIESASRVGSD